MPCRLDSLQAQRVSAGHSETRLAQLANVSVLTIRRLETPTFASGPRIGGVCSHEEADRICAALAISRGTAGFVDHHG